MHGMHVTEGAKLYQINMNQIKLANNKQFKCGVEQTIFESAKSAGVHLEHSCLAARCSSCKARVISGSVASIHDENILTAKEKADGYILTCNSKPLTDIVLDIEDLDGLTLIPAKTIPSKIDSVEKLTEDIVKLILRLPPNADFKFSAGQYVNLIYNGIKRSYSIANHRLVDNKLTFFIKNYTNGLMSDYFFNHAKPNDLLRMEGPLGTFFYRETKKQNIVFLATGTGIAPIKAILDDFQENASDAQLQNMKVTILWGGRAINDIFWAPKYSRLNFKFSQVISKPKLYKGEEKIYIQDHLLDMDLDWHDTVVYACGSNAMIQDSFNKLTNTGLDKNSFYSDAFVVSN